jgi:hypothetical protein
VPDVHVPKLDEHAGGRSIFKLVLEVALISVGVFLGLAGEQWRERTHERAMAHEALRRFRAEIVENRANIAGVKDYHVTLHKELDTEFSKPAQQRDGKNIHLHGIRPPRFDHSAWDLALGTQALSQIDADLALALSTIYNTQGSVDGMTQGVTQSMYISPPTDEKNASTFMGALMIYLGDMILYEPRLLQMYDEILPKIDKALGEKH